jgi:hypothetical protein
VVLARRILVLRLRLAVRVVAVDLQVQQVGQVTRLLLLRHRETTAVLVDRTPLRSLRSAHSLVTVVAVAVVVLAQ